VLNFMTFFIGWSVGGLEGESVGAWMRRA